MKTPPSKHQIARWVMPYVMGGLILFPLAAVADIYKWEDENGVVHYTELPPEGRQSTKIKTNHKAPSTPYIPTSKADGKATAVASQDTQQKTAEEKAKDKEYCKIATDNLATLNKHPRIRKQDDEGNYYYLSEEQKQAELNSAQKGIEDYCR